VHGLICYCVPSSQVHDSIGRRAAEMAAADPDFMQRPLAQLNAEAAAFHKADDLVCGIWCAEHGHTDGSLHILQQLS